MALRINSNITALNAYRNLQVSDGVMAKSLEKLSSGLRINRAADDAAGLVISEALRSQVNGLKVAMRNAQDGISVAQTAEGALNETHAILQRMRDLAVQAANGGANDADARAAAQDEIAELKAELDRIANSTEFNGTALLSGTFVGTFQVGPNNSSNDRITLDLSSGFTGFDSSSLGLGSVDVSTVSGAQSAIDAIDTAISTVSDARGKIGAVQNRLEHTIANLGVAHENLAASESRIRDVDMALEMVTFTKSQILQQAGVAMLAQANTVPQSVLALLR